MATADPMMTPSSAFAQPWDARPEVRSDVSGDPALTAEIWPDLASVEPIWRRLEGVGVCSPYQRFDWVSSYVAALCGREGVSTCVLSLRKGSGEPLLLLPLAIHVHRGVRIASPVGGKQANYHCPVMAPGAAAVLDPATMRDILRQAGAQAGIDVFVLQNLPRAWRGERNPLALPGATPSPSNVPTATLPAKAETLFARIGNSEARRKLRRKETGLAEMGELTHMVARDSDEVDAILDAFFRQKNERFRELGIASPFDDEASHAFMRDASLAGLDRGRPAVELHGLSLDGRIIATYGGAVDEERFSCMINSYDPSPEIARFSPGDILMTRVIAAQCGRGRTSLDLGIGEARYKRLFCEEVEELVDVFVPVTALGRLYGLAFEQFVTAKRYVKQTPRLWTFVQALRTTRAKLGFA